MLLYYGRCTGAAQRGGPFLGEGQEAIWAEHCAEGRPSWWIWGRFWTERGATEAIWAYAAADIS